MNKRTFALQNDEENTEMLPFKPNKHPHAMVSMLEIAGHVAESTSLRGQSLDKENDKEHNLGPTNYLPKTTQNRILTKNYSLSFRFFHLASFLLCFRSSRRSALSVAKDGACGDGTDTSCPLGLGITPTWSIVSATSGASSTDR